MTPLSAQVGENVILAGWIDERGSFKAFPATPVNNIESPANVPVCSEPRSRHLLRLCRFWQLNNP